MRSGLGAGCEDRAGGRLSHKMPPGLSLCTLYSSHARWVCFYRRRLGSLLLPACSMRDVSCSSASTSHWVLGVLGRYKTSTNK